MAQLRVVSGGWGVLETLWLVATSCCLAFFWTSCPCCGMTPTCNVCCTNAPTEYFLAASGVGDICSGGCPNANGSFTLTFVTGIQPCIWRSPNFTLCTGTVANWSLWIEGSPDICQGWLLRLTRASDGASFGDYHLSPHGSCSDSPMVLTYTGTTLAACTHPSTQTVTI